MVSVLGYLLAKRRVQFSLIFSPLRNKALLCFLRSCVEFEISSSSFSTIANSSLGFLASFVEWRNRGPWSFCILGFSSYVRSPCWPFSVYLCVCLYFGSGIQLRQWFFSVFPSFSCSPLILFRISKIHVIFPMSPKFQMPYVIGDTQ